MSSAVDVHLPDLAATEALARRLASLARVGDAILLEGPLGAGKTAFARAFLRTAANDPALDVPSPSFTLLQTYDTEIGPVFHYDLWRLDDAASLVELDWEDALDAIVLVEWPDRLGRLRPADALTISFRLGDGEAREATITGWQERIGGVGEPDVGQPGTTGKTRPRNDKDMVYGDGAAEPGGASDLPAPGGAEVKPGGAH